MLDDRCYFPAMQSWPNPRMLLATTLALAAALAGDPTSVAQAGATSAAGKAPASASVEVTLTQGASLPGVTVTMPVVGLSMEYPTMATDLGTGACPSPALVSALEQLGSPPLALAGDSQDMTVPSGVLIGAPPSSWEMATLYTLPAGFWSQLHCLLGQTHDPLTVGLNLKTGQPAWAEQMAAGAQSAATNGLSFSLGNEPDLYLLPNYSSFDHPPADQETLEVDLYLQLAGALRQVIGGAPVIGPELATPAHWQHELPRIISQLHLATVGVHAYPLSACLTPKAVTTGGLLTPYAGEEPRKLATAVATAQAAGVPAIISESNSVSCGGLAGVSDSPASAVWAVRFVLSALKTGFLEVRFHFSGGPYDPFILSGQEVIERPLDDAMVALGRWLPVGASLRTVPRVRGLVATSVTGASGQTLLILDNEHPAAQKVVLRKAQHVRVETFSPTRAGLQTTQLAAKHGRIQLVLAPNSVVAVSAVA